VIIFGGERGPRVAGGGPGCMALLLLSLVVSVVLTVILNVLIRLL
jgi:hypothetical protein